jgi:hypothetical protein
VNAVRVLRGAEDGGGATLDGRIVSPTNREEDGDGEREAVHAEDTRIETTSDGCCLPDIHS